MECDVLTGAVIGAAIEVHKILGPGLLESVYQKYLCYELGLGGVPCEPRVQLPVIYKGVALDCEIFMDIVIPPDELVIELKAVEALHPVHSAQLLTYMKLSRIHLGLLINFNVPLLKDGIKRLIL